MKRGRETAAGVLGGEEAGRRRRVALSPSERGAEKGDVMG